MKEILKYLRTINSYSQEKVSEMIGLSRQSYNKYEAGTVIPSDKIVRKLADLYKVDEDFIKKNRIPEIPGYDGKKSDGHPDVTYSIDCDYGNRILEVASPVPTYGVKNDASSSMFLQNDERNVVHVYEGYFKRNSVCFFEENFPFEEGQKLRITIEAESKEEEKARKKKAWNNMKSIIENHAFSRDDKKSDFVQMKKTN